MALETAGTTVGPLHVRSSQAQPLTQVSIWKRYGFAWVTGALFVLSLAGHWWLAWGAYADEQREHSRPAEVSGYLHEVGRDTLGRWQSEFLQLVWQVAGLSLLLHVGSTQSREGQDRLEEKVDALLRALDPEKADKVIAELDDRFDRGKPSA